MNYQKIYNQIVQRAKEEKRIKSKDGIYFERHHIVPKCLGGKDYKTNLVLLTAKEHFICHKLLCRIYPKSHKLIYALWAMCNQNKIGKRHIPNAIEYNKLKNEYAKIVSVRFKGIKKSSEHIIALSNSHIGSTRIWSNSTNDKRSAKLKNVSRTEEAKIKLRVPKKTQQIGICPHCNKSGQINSMKRWHFDKCKNKN